MLAPISVSAAVLINEIAWMGTAVAPQDEWLELKNDGSESVDLTGWILTIEGVRDITLDKSIVGGGYYLIERTDDNTVPNVTADLISPFGNGLNNSGVTLILKNVSGTEVDRVVSGENWSLGGDNITKDTAQRTTSGWITAAPTPKATNAAGSSPSSNPPNNQSQSTNQSSSPTTITEERPEISVNAGANRTVVVGADALFSGKALGADGKPLDNVRFLWNFGDGETREGQNVLHRFRFPGEYIVTLDIAYGKWSVAARLTAIAIKSPLIISRVEKGAAGLVELTNEGGAELDLFGWHLQSGTVSFLIPKNTAIIGGKKIIFPNEVTDLAGPDVLLLYPNGVVAAVFEAPPEKIIEVKKILPAKQTDSPRLDTPIATSAIAAVYEAAPERGGIGVWLLALGGLIVLSISAIIFTKQKSIPVADMPVLADEYKIIE